MRLRRREYKSPPRIVKSQAPKVTQPNQTQPNQNHKTVDTQDVSLQDALNKLYSDINSVPSYSAKINEFLRNNHVHSVHRRIIKKTFPRRKIIARFPFDIWMGDLIEYPNYKFQNRQFTYILILIDCFTKKVYAAPMRNKSMQWSTMAFETIFNKLDEFPTHIVTDGGLGLLSDIFHLLKCF